MKKFIAPFIIVFTQLCLGCSSTNNQSAASLVFSFSDPNRIQFQGKGAGAGIALMSAMGPMGIAVGVAIDEGIAKDIRAATSEQGFDMRNLLSHTAKNVTVNQFTIRFEEASLSGISSSDNDYMINVEKYGYKIVDGNNDLTAAVLVISWTDKKGVAQKIRYPQEFENVPAFPLEEVRDKGVKANSLLADAVEAVLKKYWILQQI
ncbi:hypothetical protein AN944_00268 [Shewanella sp. P1-14-1]|uniref:hypothetical protein n=1 Tax=Shewanella sp. P1-14-1 TaxID=1723761 RepID=UPI0006D68F93|nr:hypothetical protein [Shewanella sp. P1-14-1]KPZ73120.1 hypothetical protein AN944_00268 [Shewanella sp. P1-14-1]